MGALEEDLHSQTLLVQAALKKVGQVLAANRLSKGMAAAATKVNKYGLVVGGGFERGVLGLSPAKHPWQSGLADIEKWMAEFGQSRYTTVADVTRQKYMEIILKNMKENAPWKEVRDSIEEEFGDMHPGRVSNIATTETTTLYGAGAQGFRNKYEIPFKQWITSFMNSRPTHIRAHMQLIPNGSKFKVGHDTMMFPGEGSLAEENCNCNCVAVGAIEKD